MTSPIKFLLPSIHKDNLIRFPQKVFLTPLLPPPSLHSSLLNLPQKAFLWEVLFNLSTAPLRNEGGIGRETAPSGQPIFFRFSGVLVNKYFSILLYMHITFHPYLDPMKRYREPHFTDLGNYTHRGEVTCSKAHSSTVLELGIKHATSCFPKLWW